MPEVVTSCRLLCVHPKINTTPIAWPATTSVSIRNRCYSKRNLTMLTLPTQLRLQTTTPHRSFLTKTIRELYLPNHTKFSTHDAHKRPPQIKPPWEHKNLHCHSCIRLAVTSMTNMANYGREYPYCKPWHMRDEMLTRIGHASQIEARNLQAHHISNVGCKEVHQFVPCSDRFLRSVQGTSTFYMCFLCTLGRLWSLHDKEMERKGRPLPVEILMCSPNLPHT